MEIEEYVETIISMNDDPNFRIVNEGLYFNYQEMFPLYLYQNSDVTLG